MKKIITYGTYDMLHQGHINLIRRAKNLGDYLIVGVTSEDYDRSRGKLHVMESEEKRLAAVAKLDFVDEVILETHKNQKAEDIQKYNIDIFAIGDDWVGRFDYLQKYTEVIYLPRTKGISSTQLRESISPVNIAVIGFGKDAKRFIEESKEVTQANIIALYETNLNDDVYAYLSQEDIPYIYEDFSTLVNSSVDAIYICSNFTKHEELTKLALLANIHVLSESLLELKEEKLEEFFNLSIKQKLLIVPALKTAFLPAFNQLFSEINDGIIGDIKEVKATFTSLYKEQDVKDEFYERGATKLLMHFPLLLISKVLGEHKKVDFYPQMESNYDISNRAIASYSDNSIGIATVGIGMKSESDAIISGTKGYIYIPAPWWLTKEFFCRFEESGKSYHFEYEFKGEGISYMIAEFCTLIQRKEYTSSRLNLNTSKEVNKVIAKYLDKG